MTGPVKMMNIGLRISFYKEAYKQVKAAGLDYLLWQVPEHKKVGDSLYMYWVDPYVMYFAGEEL